MTLRYRPEIDGLRAVAVLPVILFHAGFETFSGGFVGVDIFFVISGYLITSIILQDLETDSFSLLQFYENRARRILPALFFMLAVAYVIGWLILFPENMEELSKSLVATVLFVSNIFFWEQTGYFETAAELKPLLHTWSLAVEEQYYLLFPLFLMMLWRRAASKIGLALLVLGVLSLVAAEFVLPADREAAFYLLPFRLWELAIGGYAAHFLSKRASQSKSLGAELAGATGVGLIFWSMFLFDRHTPFPGFYALFPTVGTALIILFVSPDTVVGRTLASPPFVGVGLISYSAYLWHQPLLAFARHRSLSEPPLWSVVSICILTFVIAYFSWRFVESPFRRKEKGVSRRTIFATSTAGGLAIIAFGLAGDLSEGFESAFVAELNERQKNIWHGRTGVPHKKRSCHIATHKQTQAFQARFTKCATQHNKALVVVGDSHAMNLFRAMSNWSAPFIVRFAKGGCWPYAAGTSVDCHYDDFLRFVREKKGAISRVIFLQAGYPLVLDREGRQAGRSNFRAATVVVHEPNIDAITEVSQFLQRVSTYAPVTWAGPWLELHLNITMIKRLALQCVIQPVRPNSNTIQTFKSLDKAIAEVLRGFPSIKYVSLIQALEFDSSKDIYDCNGSFWRDGDHWSQAGEQRFSPRLERALYN